MGMYGLIYGGPEGAEKFVMASGNGDILSSIDGENWTLEGTDLGYLRDVTYGNSRYVAVGEGGSVAVSSSLGDGLAGESDKGAVSVPAVGWFGLVFLVAILGIAVRGSFKNRSNPVT